MVYAENQPCSLFQFLKKKKYFNGVVLLKHIYNTEILEAFSLHQMIRCNSLLVTVSLKPFTKPLFFVKVIKCKQIRIKPAHSLLGSCNFLGSVGFQDLFCSFRNPLSRQRDLPKEVNGPRRGSGGGATRCPNNPLRPAEGSPCFLVSRSFPLLWQSCVCDLWHSNLPGQRRAAGWGTD